jgi:hypothetical protein
VGFGLWLIVRHETRNPNRVLLENQMRGQIARSLEHAAATFTPARLGVSEITVPVATGKLDTAADEVVMIVSRLGGSATKGLQDRDRLSVLVDVPSNREQEFRAVIEAIGREEPGSSTSAKAMADKPTPTTATISPTAEKKSFVVQIVEGQSKSD